jgi:polyhydroxyalkanoate synthesis regulator phasin
MRRLNVTLDEPTDEILRRVAKPGDEAAYVRAAIIEKAARDEQRAEVDQLRAQVKDLEARLASLERALQQPPTR